MKKTVAFSLSAKEEELLKNLRKQGLAHGVDLSKSLLVRFGLHVINEMPRDKFIKKISEFDPSVKS